MTVSFDTNIFVYANPFGSLRKKTQATMLTLAEPWLDHADARQPALFVPFQGASPWAGDIEWSVIWSEMPGAIKPSSRARTPSISRLQ